MFREQVEALYTALVGDVPIILWGPPGTGKTATLTHLARRLGWHLEVLIGATRDRTDFGGFPVAHEGRVSLVPLPWLTRLLEKGRESILFLDELSSTPEDVRPALLRVINERVAGDTPIPSRIAAAANPAEIAVGGFDLEPPIANRLLHLEWNLTPQEWAQGLREGWDTIYPKLPPPPPPETLAAHQEWARDMVALYLERNPTHAYHLPQGEGRGRAWPSYRTWTMAAQALGTARALGFGESVQSTLVAGAVGKAGYAFMTFLLDLDLPDPKEVLHNPSLLPSRDDRAYATLMSVASLVVSEWSEERWKQAWRVLGHAAQEGRADIAVPAAGRLIRAHQRAREERKPTWTFPEAAQRFLPLVQKVAEMRR
ncbi:ATP-binding protein [Thermus caldilimi]|uniref:ATP-binding protein n=1 Tax=Thermus caldilimi TaxID=2483360 RepID=UPI0010763BD6|nr:AAA family ATPase [Thermus caldilimi]